MAKITKEEKIAKKEAKKLLKGIEKEDCKTPKDEKDILKWTMPELRMYILSQTADMGSVKKIKWVRALDKRIKEAKKKVSVAV
jgi:hypothetical protein